MAVLTKKQILERVEKGDIAFTPALDTFQVQGHSVDLRLGYTFLIHKSWRVSKEGREALSIDPLENGGASARHFDIIELEEGQYFELLPNEHVTVSSLETVKVPNDLMAVLYPRSSVNRRGVSVDLTGIVDAGYEGQLVIPVKNHTSQVIRLYPGERFCQLVFEELAETIQPRKSRHHLKDIVDEPQKEDDTELELIKKGKITELKKEHGV
ncbi:MAG: dCTP deaminase [bacterium]|nr:dCTP deaminase [bacterium]